MDSIPTAQELSEKIRKDNTMDSIPTAQELSEKIRKSTITTFELKRINDEAIRHMITYNYTSSYTEDWTPNMINFMKGKGYMFSCIDDGPHKYCKMYTDSKQILTLEKE